MRAFVAGEASFESLVARVRNDAAWRTHLGTRLRTVGDRDERAALLALLEAAPADEALRWIAELAASGEPARRAEAWRWLATLPIEDPGVRALVQQALHAEPDPAALAVLVATLQPGLLAEEDAAPIADALLAFARGAEPRLRAAALPALSQWMHASALEGICLDALRDADHSVRGAAIAALDSAGLRPAAARGALLRIAGDRDEPPANRHAALLALAGYRLDRAEMALYRELQRELPLHPGTG
ncbi:MAG: hypothetical protein DYH17_12670 [Xanthomonadales bacterium PRO6]|nr:hypothetical protein [Xanthomonadales bacterium PRO6]